MLRRSDGEPDIPDAQVYTQESSIEISSLPQPSQTISLEMKKYILKWWPATGKESLKSCNGNNNKKSQVWTRLTDDLNEEFRTRITKDKVVDCFYNIKRDFRKYLTQSKQSGNSTQYYELSVDCQDVFQNDEDIYPRQVVQSDEPNPIDTATPPLPRRPESPPTTEPTPVRNLQSRRHIEMESRQQFRRDVVDILKSIVTYLQHD